MKTLKDVLTHFRQVRNFNPEIWVSEKLKTFEDYLAKNKLKGAVISVSGGVDSAVVFALCKKASLSPTTNLQRVIAVAQPIHSTEAIWKRALELGTTFDHPILTVDQTDLFDRLVQKVEHETRIPESKFAAGQLRSYMRTPVNYYLAQLYSSIGIPTVVMGTGNYDEDGYLFYFCKAGDGVVDVALISDLHKSEVFQVANYLGVPESICKAAPSADLWEGQTDEEEMGVTYDFVELYTEFLKLSSEKQREILESLDMKEREEFYAKEKIVQTIHNRNKHKINFPVCL